MQLISLIIPFRSDCGHRDDLLDWLVQYWRCELPNAEIVIGHDPYDDCFPFSKTTAVNEGFSRCHGDVIVLIDADAYVPGKTIEHAAARIRKARERGTRLWFVPYLQMYRLKEHSTFTILKSDPKHPKKHKTPPEWDDVEELIGAAFGRRFGALIQILPREAFETVGGMDPRFRGWGGEDVSFLRAVDTLWGRHKNLPGDVLHLWHPKFNTPGTDSDKWHTRVWSSQKKPRANDWLSTQYDRATGKPEKMRALVEEGFVHPGPWGRFKHWCWKCWVHLHCKKRHCS